MPIVIVLTSAILGKDNETKFVCEFIFWVHKIVDETVDNNRANKNFLVSVILVVAADE